MDDLLIVQLYDLSIGHLTEEGGRLQLLLLPVYLSCPGLR